MAGFSLSPLSRNIADIVQVVLQLMQGRSNSVGVVTLRAGFATTVVTKNTDPAAVNMSPDCEVFFAAKTANAAAVQFSLWTSNQGFGTFTIHHVSDANVDKTFAFEIRGNA
jgi:hypothetical protein